MGSVPEEPSRADRLYAVASGQEGLFTSQQAVDSGHSPQLLSHHQRSGRVLRVRRGIYRLAHFPAGEHEELVAAWLWSNQEGIFSHATALLLHGLSDALPARADLTLPPLWKNRRVRPPEGLVIHHGVVLEQERRWYGAVPITSVLRTLEDCARAHLDPHLLQQATRQALQRGLVAEQDLLEVHTALRPYGGTANGADNGAGTGDVAAM